MLTNLIFVCYVLIDYWCAPLCAVFSPYIVPKCTGFKWSLPLDSKKDPKLGPGPHALYTKHSSTTDEGCLQVLFSLGQGVQESGKGFRDTV